MRQSMSIACAMQPNNMEEMYMVLAGFVLALLGLVICFRGIYIGKIFKAIFGAIQGAIYALALQIILVLLRLATQNIIIWLVVLFAGVFAIIAALKEELYKKIQGIINATMIGGILGAIVYVWIKVATMYQFTDSESNAFALLAGFAVVAIFMAMGVRWYRGFRRIGTFILTIAICTMLFAIYIPPLPALIGAAVVAFIFVAILNAYEKYIDYLKISAIGASLAVFGVFTMFDRAELIVGIPSMLLDNMGGMISGYGGYSYYGTETVLAVLGIIVLSIAGMFSQYNYVAAHTDANGNVVLNWSMTKQAAGTVGGALGQLFAGVVTGIHSVFSGIGSIFRRNKAAILRAAKAIVIILGVCGLVAGLIYGGTELYHKWEAAKDDGYAGDAATRFVREINNAYGTNLISVTDSSYVGAAGDGFDATFEANISGELSGQIIAYGNSDPDSDAWYPEYVSVEVEADDRTTSKTARLFAAVIAEMFDVDQADCEGKILDALLGGIDTSSYTPWIEVDLGRTANITAQLSLTEDNRAWNMSCWPKF